MVMGVPGKRRRARPKRRWLDSIRDEERLFGETIVRDGSATPSQMEASPKKHRPSNKSGEGCGRRKALHLSVN